MFDVAFNLLKQIILLLKYPFYVLFGILTLFFIIIGFYIVLGLIKR